MFGSPCPARFVWSLVALTTFMALCGKTAATVVDVTSPTTNWTPVTYASGNSDPSTDQQTGSEEGDIVGNTTHPAFYTAFGDAGTPSLTDGTIGFRGRLGADANPAGVKA